MTVLELLHLLKEGEVTPTQLVQQSIDTIKKNDDAINAVVHPRFEAALRESKRDYSNTVFKGMPILLKSLGQNLRGEPSTAASLLLKDSISNTTDHFVQKILDLGFIVLGQTNSPEFGFKNISDSMLYGDVKNPRDTTKTPGGSSGGAAAALSLNYVPVVAASDGGGSIRIPASYTNLVGLKPTRGSMPAGPNGYRGWQGASVNFFITQDVADAAFLFEHMQSNTIQAPFNYVKFKDNNKKNLRIAVSDVSPVGTVVSQDAKDALNEAVKTLKDMGHTVEYVTPQYDGMRLMETYYMVNGVETAAMMKSIEASLNRKVRIDDMQLTSWCLYQYGLSVAGYQVVDALNYWDNVSAILHAFHETYDVYITPTNADVAPEFDKVYQDEALLERMRNIETDHNPYGVVWDMFEHSLRYTPFTMLANITGQPAISVPFYENEKQEAVGIQIMAPKGAESLLFKISDALMQHKNRL